MKRNQPYSLLPIPATIDPVGRRCFTVNVPDDPTHIAAFRGALNALATWQVWQFDDAHSGKDVAAVWRTVTDEITECEMIALRRKPTDFCMLQLSTDGGATWTDVFDASDCAHAAAVSEITDAINDGRLAPIGQQPPKPYQPSGQCTSYDVTLQANGRWHSPIPVQANDTINITNVRGGWFDGDLDWNCPDGSDYLLGFCTGSGTTESGDPAPTVNHMRLIANWDTTFVDAYNQIITIPGGVSLTELYLQANDATLSDNQGSIQFHVEICSAGCAVPSSGLAGCTVTDNMDGTFTMAVASSNAADGDFQAVITIESVYDTPPGTDCHAVFNIDSITGFTQPHMSHFPGGWGSGSGCTIDNHLSAGDDPNTLNGVVFCAFLYIRSGTPISVTFHF